MPLLDPRAQRSPARGLYRRLLGGPRRGDQESVLAHLQVLLNSHLGESLSAPGLGILDFADIVHGFPASTQVLSHSIRATILQHEPRLRSVTVTPTHSDDPLALAFEISGRLVGDDQRGPLRVRTELSAGGRFHCQAQ
jgi:type VI secretion system protein